MIALRWYKRRCGSTWIQRLQYQAPNGKWIDVPEVTGDYISTL